MGDLVVTSPDLPERSMMDTAVSRQAQEVQAGMIMAKRFPRDEEVAYARIMKACKRPKLAESACYAYDKGSSTVTGPSIRLAEVLAQSWGNIDFGIIELEQKPAESIMMAYAWDLETNTRETKVFTVPHIRSKRSGNVRLTDPRDIYELTANMGARRMRACVLGIIPGDIVDAAVDACEATLRDASDEPLSDRLRTMVAAFDGLGVTKEMLESKIGHILSTTSEHELVKLRQIFTSIKDNFADVNSFFETSVDKPSAKVQSVQEKLAARRKKEEAPPDDSHEHSLEAEGALNVEGKLEVEGTAHEDAQFEGDAVRDLVSGGEEESPFDKEGPGALTVGPPVQAPSAEEPKETFTKLSDIKFESGPHKGKTVAEVAKSKPSYVRWMAKRAGDAKIRAACSAMLEVSESPQEIIIRIRATAASIPMKPEDLDKFVADGYNNKKLEDLTVEELEAVDRFMQDTAS